MNDLYIIISGERMEKKELNARMTLQYLQRILVMFAILTITMIFFSTEKAQASTVNATFDYENNLFGDGTKQFGQHDDASGETLKAVSVNDTMGKYSVMITPINGSESLASSYEYIGETSITFSLVSGNQFNLSAIKLQDFTNQSQEVTFTSSKGTVSFTLVGAATYEFSAPVDDPDSNMQGITSFTITASGCSAYGSATAFGIAFDDIVLQDIRYLTPTVTGISPAAGPTAGGTNVTITGTNFTGATSVTIGGAAATGVTVVNATTITATTPAGAAGAANVVVTTPGGTATGTGLYTYAAAPTVTGISPSSGPETGGTSVTITGTNFTGATSVTIGGTAATGITVVNATTITATTPAGVAGARDVVVTTPGGTATGTGLYTYIPAPTISSISPSSGPAGGGTSVTITGTNLTGATGVTIGGTAATGITVVNATTITATTPAGTAGTANIVVTTPGGTATGTGMYTYIAAPTVTGISPAAGPTAGGTNVTITGTNFTGATSVTIGGAAATGVTVVNATTITATTPAGAAGAANVVVTTPGGTATGTGLYTYAAAPTVTGISPSSGSTMGGTSITITGTNFTGATIVTIGGTAATGITVVNATTITATTSAGAAGTANVVVTTPGGTATGTNLYTYIAAPTVTDISPSSGSATGGTSVTITGTNLTGATSITIGGAAATSVTVVNATTITATTPAGAAGLSNVVVTTPGGTATGTNLYTYIAAPTVTGISPAAGPTAGGTSVTIIGTNFTGATSVTVGGTAATGVTVVNATTITATTPAGAAGAANVVVTTPGGTVTGTGLYTYVAAPTVTGISPATGPTAGGTSVTITGTNFTGATSITIGGAVATSVTVVNATTIAATTPAGAAGTADVVVTTPGGTATGTGLYTYIAAPTISIISPSSGPSVGGTIVTITGTDFTGATNITIGGTAATSVTVVNSTTITATTPVGAVGVANVVVTTAGGTATGTNIYTYLPNSLPTFTGGANIGLTINEDAAAEIISKGLLEVKDAEQTPSNLTFTIVAIPTKGVLKNGSTVLVNASTFTQEDINAGRLTFQPSTDQNGSDAFIFTVSDGNGGVISNTTFSISMTAVNDIPSGVPSISGTTTEGQTLTAATSGISDIDTLGTFSYKWQVSVDGSTGWQDILGAGSSNYTLTVNEVDKYVRVIVSYTDGDGSLETLNSMKSVKIRALTNAVSPNITTQPAVNTVKVGDSAEFSVIATGVSLSYQWYKNTEDNTTGGTLIAGATSATYHAPTTTAGIMFYYCSITNTDPSVTGITTATVKSNTAKLEVKEAYTITYNANGGNGTAPTDNAKYDVGQMINLASSALTKNGYRFGGWSISQNGSAITGTTYVMGSSDIVVYAVWIENPPTVSTPIVQAPVISPTDADTNDRRANINGVNNSSTSMVSSVDIVRKESEDKRIDTVELNQEKTEEILKSVLEQKQDIIQIVVTDIPDNLADEVLVTVNKDSVQSMSNKDIALDVKTKDVAIRMPASTLRAISENDKDLYFRVSPIKDEKMQAEEIQNAITAEVVQAAAGKSEVVALGTPMIIETNYQNLTTTLTFSLEGITIPDDEEQRAIFINSLGVYIKHSDGEQELNRGKIVYDESGKPIGLEIEISKFSTFTIVSIKNAAPVAKKLKLSGTAVIGKVLTATYSYQDQDGDTQGNSIVKWYRADNKRGKNKKLISKASLKKYKITKKDQGKYIIVEVTPVAETGENIGLTVSASIKVVATAKNGTTKGKMPTVSTKKSK